MVNHICFFCKQPIAGQAILTPTSKDGEHVLICQRCYSIFGTCGACQHSTSCAFEDPSIPIPPRVQKQFRKGNQMISTIVDNPERINATCAAGCKCWDAEDQACNREAGTCANYTEVYFTTEGN